MKRGTAEFLVAGFQVRPARYQSLDNRRVVVECRRQMKRSTAEFLVAGFQVRPGRQQRLDNRRVGALRRPMKGGAAVFHGAGFQVRPGRYQLLDSRQIAADRRIMKRGIFATGPKGPLVRRRRRRPVANRWGPRGLHVKPLLDNIPAPNHQSGSQYQHQKRINDRALLLLRRRLRLRFRRRRRLRRRGGPPSGLGPLPRIRGGPSRGGSRRPFPHLRRRRRLRLRFRPRRRLRRRGGRRPFPYPVQGCRLGVRPDGAEKAVG